MDDIDTTLAPPGKDTIRLHFTEKEKGGLFDVYIPTINFDLLTPGHADGKYFTVMRFDIGQSTYCVTESIEEIKQLIQQAQSRQSDEM